MSGAVRVLIVDDEPHAREGLRRIVSARPGFTVAGECGDGESAISAIQVLKPDLVLLDVQMPPPDGFAVLRALGPDCLPAVVFVTAFEEYAVRAFEAHAVDYVMKPFSDRRLLAAMDRARRTLEQGRLAALIDSIDRIVVRSLGRTDVVPVSDIAWIEASDYCVKLHAGGRPVVHREALASLEKKLGSRFVRAHRAALVNLAHVRTVRVAEGGECEIVTVAGDHIPVSRSRRRAVDAALRGAGR